MGWFNKEKILRGIKKCPECETNKFYEFQEDDTRMRISIICLGCGFETKKYWQSIEAVHECNKRAEDGSRKTITNKENNIRT